MVVVVAVALFLNCFVFDIVGDFVNLFLLLFTCTGMFGLVVWLFYEYAHRSVLRLIDYPNIGSLHASLFAPVLADVVHRVCLLAFLCFYDEFRSHDNLVAIKSNVLLFSTCYGNFYTFFNFLKTIFFLKLALNCSLSLCCFCPSVGVIVSLRSVAWGERVSVPVI